MLQIIPAIRRSSLALAVALAVAASGCAPGRPARSVHLVEGFDDSDGARLHLGDWVRSGARLAAHLSPGADRLTLLAVDFRTTELSDHAAPDSSEATLALLNRRLRTRPKRPGTYPDRFWSEAARRARDGRRPVAIAYYSDGDADDFGPASADQIRSAARTLAANSQVAAVAIYGVDPQNRCYLGDCFSPLGERFQMFGPEEIDTQPLAERLDAARTAEGDVHEEQR